MVERVVRLVAIVCTVLLLLSFGLFAIDELGGASKRQQQALAETQPSRPGELPQPARQHQPRRFIDGAARTLIEPFSGLTSSKERWVNRTLPTLIGLLVYGLGLGVLSRYARALP
jgi:hypothetical protein